MTFEILKAPNKADKELAELKGLAKKLPNQSMLVNTIVVGEAKTSTTIKNIFITDDKLYKALLGNGFAVEPGTKKTLRYRQAPREGFINVKHKKIFTVEMIIKIYREIK